MKAVLKILPILSTAAIFGIWQDSLIAGAFMYNLLVLIDERLGNPK